MQNNTGGLEISPSPKVCFSSYSPTLFDLILGAPVKHGGGLCFGRSIKKMWLLKRRVMLNAKVKYFFGKLADWTDSKILLSPYTVENEF